MTNKPESKKIETFLHNTFEFGLALKLFNGTWETISGILILLSNKYFLRHFAYLLFRGEILSDPNDAFISYVTYLFDKTPQGAKKFVAIYILSHGILNIFLAYQLYRKKLWSYKLAIGVLIVLAIYQIHRIQLYHSTMLFYLTVLDFIFIALTWHEYTHQRKSSFK